MTDHSEAVRQARATYDAARKALFDAIHAAIDAKIGPSQIARDSNFTREYITKIGKAEKARREVEQS
jgi:hypothetical protein